MKIKSISGVETMRKTIFIFLIFLSIYGCDPDRKKEFQPIETLLADFSKKITGYYGKQGQDIPPDFDEDKFIAILKEKYPDQEKVKIVEKYVIKARAVGRFYSVMLCDVSSKKIMEDLSCDMAKVEIRLWDKDTAYPCEFEVKWESLCK